MRSRPSIAASCLATMALAAVLLLQPAVAQDTAPAKVGEAGSKPAEGSPAPAASSTPPAPAGQGGAKPDDGNGKPDATATPPASAKGSPQRFEPTEKVRPDFDVAFPVDI